MKIYISKCVARIIQSSRPLRLAIVEGLHVSDSRRGARAASTHLGGKGLKAMLTISDHDGVTGLDPVWDKGGRPSLYDPSFCIQVRRLARLGLPCTTKQLAAFFDVCERTVERWKALFPEFCQSIREGRLPSDCLVAERLFERAVGFECIEQQAFKIKRVVARRNALRFSVAVS